MRDEASIYGARVIPMVRGMVADQVAAWYGVARPVGPC